MTLEYDYLEIVKNLKTKLNNIEVTKKDEIVKLKDNLVKQNYKSDDIAVRISKDLRGFVTSSYIRQVLDPQFKQEEKANKPKIVMNADGSQAEAETEGGENDEDGEGTVTAAAGGGKTKGQMAREEWEKNKYTKNMGKIGAATTKAIQQKQQQQGQQQQEDGDSSPIAEQQQDSEMLIVNMSPVHFNKVQDLMKYGRVIHLNINMDTNMVIGAFTNDDGE